MSQSDENRSPVRVFISYAHDDAEHDQRVRDLWLLLRNNGIDAKLDLPAAERRQDWVQWMMDEVRAADYVVIVASPQYKRRAEGQADDNEGRGVQFEAKLIQEEVYSQRKAAVGRFLPVVLPGGSASDIPIWLNPNTHTHYRVTGYTVDGMDPLYRYLTGQPRFEETELGPVAHLPGEVVRLPVGAYRPGPTAGLRTEVRIEVQLVGDRLSAATTIAGTLLGHREGQLPSSVSSAWKALDLGPGPAADRLAEAGRELASALFDASTSSAISALVDRLPPGDGVDLVLYGDGAALSLPIELLRLAGPAGVDAGPVCLLAGVTIRRQVASAPLGEPVRLPGPVKILAAVAAPDETKTASSPLLVEAEMQAVLDATASLPGESAAQVQILEVASAGQIQRALATGTGDAYHVLHLSAHGSSTAVELEDEDGAPVTLDVGEMMAALRRAGRPVPLIVLSACSAAAGGDAEAMAAGLIARGADRVIAMQAPVLDTYATALTAELYRSLVRDPTRPVAQLLAGARTAVEQKLSRDQGVRRESRLPQFGLATLLCAAGDAGLVDPAVPTQPLKRVVSVPIGGSVRELTMGQLIGRRKQLRETTALLRRAPDDVDRYGLTGGAALIGVGGIGKTAIAGRVINRLRNDGWVVVVHEGKWNPTALFQDVAAALAPGANTSGTAPGVAETVGALADAAVDDLAKLPLVEKLLRVTRLLLVFDDFEQNLTPGGAEFIDPAAGQALAGLANAAAARSDAGALLLTCRYPLPAPVTDLFEVPVPPLSTGELRRLLLRLPALRDLGPDDRRLLSRSIGGHPRLIEFVDALLRGGRTNLAHVKDKLRNLATREQVDLAEHTTLDDATEQAMLLGAADILLEDLVTLLTPEQRGVLDQIAVSRAAMSRDDLAFALTGDPASRADKPLTSIVEWLTDLTLLPATPEVVMHPWTADLITRNVGIDLGAHHERALAMRYRRFEQGRGGYEDLLEIPRHLAYRRRYNEAATVVIQGADLLGGTLATLAYLAEVRPLIPDNEAAWTQVVMREFRATVDSGNLVQAQRLLLDLRQQVENRVAGSPDDTKGQVDLSVLTVDAGDLAVARGDLPAARSHYQDALMKAQARSLDNPVDPLWLRRVSLCHERLGDVAGAAGDLTGARTAYQAALDIAVRLAAADPANTDWQRDLSVNHNKLGGVALAAGDLAAARTAFQADLDIAVRLAAADPANAGWQRDLSISHDKLGEVAMAAGDLAGARAAYQAALDIALRLAAADPANAGWQRDLSVTHNRLGDVAVVAGDLEAARTAFQAGLDIRVRLVAADSANLRWQRDLSISHVKVGDVAVAAGDLAAARTAFQAGLEIAVRLAAADSANSGWQRDLSVSHERLGNLERAAGNLDAAADHYQVALEIAERLAALDPTNAQWRRDVQISLDRVIDLRGPAEQPQEAIGGRRRGGWLRRWRPGA